MCGIVGYVGRQDGVPIVLEGLHRLEYRGYDSAGIAVVTRSGLRVHRKEGRIRRLEASLPARLKGSPSIGHTRWATHGEPSDENAHPHTDTAGRVAVVHNGIVENAAALRERLEAAGHRFSSETDTEVLAHLIADAGPGPLEARVREALAQVDGTYGIAVLDAEEPDVIVAARNGSPVILGIGAREMFVASDVAALVRHTRQVVHLDDGDLAVVRADGFQTTGLEADAEPRPKSPLTVSYGQEALELGEHEHFMHKEIFAQPEACERTLRGRLDRRFQTAHLGGLELSPRELLDIRRIKILGCGSAYYAGQMGAHLIEALTRVPADAEPASEFRYRNPVIEKDCLYVAVSQSGETFDTLAAVQEIRRKGGRVLGIVNAVGSTIARECDGGIYLHAGPEVAVVSTKTFTCTALAFALIALHLGRIRDLGPDEGRRLMDALERIPEQITSILDGETSEAGGNGGPEGAQVDEVAGWLASHRSVFFIGRTRGYPVAREGAQKLKEVSYVHAEAYPASELKHGPLALITPETPTLVVLPRDSLYEKNLSSIEEIKARRGPVVALTHPGDPRIAGLADHVLTVPPSLPELDPILLGIPLQLLAYHAALALERDVDKPRNLAKSVTVE
jgi:glucosamine--fructose-6-phosphate aminotransferase (isomerizing)